MDLRTLKLYMATKFGMARVNAVFEEIQMIVIRSLQSVQQVGTEEDHATVSSYGSSGYVGCPSPQVMIQDKHCFEIYGYDVMVDDTLKPWLIEVNASPSLTANTKLDHDLKFKMLNDALDIVDMEEKVGRSPLVRQFLARGLKALCGGCVQLEGDELVVGGFCQILAQNNIIDVSAVVPRRYPYLPHA
jgi:hypothetical protein